MLNCWCSRQYVLPLFTALMASQVCIFLIFFYLYSLCIRLKLCVYRQHYSFLSCSIVIFCFKNGSFSGVFSGILLYLDNIRLNYSNSARNLYTASPSDLNTFKFILCALTLKKFLVLIIKKPHLICFWQGNCA